MTNIIWQYYQGITQQLQSEVSLINSLFQHQGVKGEGNETVLRELLTRFIPKKYGIGTGVVIDRHGNQGRQCDIVIYDTFLYPSLLSLSTIHLFPIDIVYATIEVKTTLNAQSAKEALMNIASVRRLDIIKNNFMLTESYSGGVGLVSYEPYPPMGFVFAYQSEVQQFETFKRWFTPTDPNEAPNFPTAVGCLDQGLVRFKNNQPQVGMQPEGWAIPLVIPLSASNVSPITDPDENYTYNGITYPVKKVLGDPVAIDQSRVLLLFVLYLNEMLSYKKLNPAFSFMDQYMTDEMKLHLLVE